MKILLGAGICLAALSAWPAIGTAVAAHSGPGVAKLQVEARSLSEPRAIERALEEFGEIADPIEKAVAEAVAEFYRGRDFEPLWIENGRQSRPMTELRRLMERADLHGLDPARYAIPDIEAAPERAAEAEIAFSRAAALFATHLASGRIQPRDVSRIITRDPERPDVADILSRLSTADRMERALGRYEPPHPDYAALKTMLAELRASEDEEPAFVIPAGRLLRPGMRDDRVPLLRARLALEVDPSLVAIDLYDPPLVEALKAFQAANGLAADGVLGPRSLAALNGPNREADIASIIANMERWRWMPRDLGAFHVMVNVPEFRLRVLEDGAVVHETKVIVGQPRYGTPSFSDAIEYLVVNPYWHVPASIVRNEMLPEIRRNPRSYFREGGYEALAEVGGRMRVINPAYVDWYGVNPNDIRIRQTPGDHNALGRIKFMFPNQHSVYLHDTPSKSLFEREARAFSHGCVRVENPLAFADAILKIAAPDWNSARLEALYGGQERRIDLDRSIPVHLGYFTFAVAEDASPRRFEDIYGFDKTMKDLLDQQAVNASGGA